MEQDIKLIGKTPYNFGSDCIRKFAPALVQAASSEASQSSQESQECLPPSGAALQQSVFSIY